jgi:hypothetical protein
MNISRENIVETMIACLYLSLLPTSHSHLPLCLMRISTPGCRFDVCGDMTFRVSWFELEFMCGGGRTNTKTWNAVNGMSTMEVLR